MERAAGGCARCCGRTGTCSRCFPCLPCTGSRCVPCITSQRGDFKRRRRFPDGPRKEGRLAATEGACLDMLLGICLFTNIMSFAILLDDIMLLHSFVSLYNARMNESALLYTNA